MRQSLSPVVPYQPVWCDVQEQGSPPHRSFLIHHDDSLEDKTRRVHPTKDPVSVTKEQLSVLAQVKHFNKDPSKQYSVEAIIMCGLWIGLLSKWLHPNSKMTFIIFSKYSAFCYMRFLLVQMALSIIKCISKFLLQGHFNVSLYYLLQKKTTLFTWKPYKLSRGKTATLINIALRHWKWKNILGVWPLL